MEGDLYCWGRYADGLHQLREQVVDDDPVWSFVSSISEGLCAVTASGQGYCVPELPDALSGWEWKELYPATGPPCGLTKDGHGYCWFPNDGIIGSKDVTVSRPRGSEGRTWVRMTADTKRHAMNAEVICLQDNKDVLCWEYDVSQAGFAIQPSFTEGYVWSMYAPFCGVSVTGELVCREEQEPPLPQDLQFSKQLWAAVSSDLGRRCALSTLGEVYCWGFELYMSLDHPKVPAPQIAGFSGRFCAALADNNTVTCWGPDASAVSYGTEILHGTSLSVGLNSACVLTQQGSISCSGLCLHGECDPPGGSSVVWRLAVTGFQSTCGITTDSVLCCWGLLISAELTCDDQGKNSLKSPQQWKGVAVGRELVCGYDELNLRCWKQRNFLLSVQSPSGWVAATCLRNDGCALKGSGELYCFGQAEGTGIASYPSGVNGNPKLTNIAQARDIRCGLLANGTAICDGWFAGKNEYAVLLPGHEFMSIALVDYVACGVKMNHKILCDSFVQGPTRSNSAVLDVRFAHLSGIRAGSMEICGYAYLERRHKCLGFKTDVPPVEEGALAIPVNTWRMLTHPSSTMAAPEGSEVVLSALQDLQQPQLRVRRLGPVQFVTGGEARVTLVFKNQGFAGYGSLDTDNLRIEELFDVTPIPFADIVEFQASDTTACALSTNLKVWCKGAFEAHADEIGPVHGISVADTHACGIENATRSLVCWGEAIPSLTTETDPETIPLRQVATRNNLTCGVSEAFEVYCWGNEHLVNESLTWFTGSGWLEIVLKANRACASHINGRLLCVMLVGDEGFGVIPPFLSSPELVVGLAPTAAVAGNLCTSIESCLTTDPATAPFHHSLVLIEDVTLQRPLQAPLRFLGVRTAFAASTETKTITCQFQEPTLLPCILMQPSSERMGVANVRIIGNQGTMLEVQDRPELSLVHTTWLGLRNSTTCRRSAPMVWTKNVPEISVAFSSWSLLEQECTAPGKENLNGLANAVGGGIVTHECAQLSIVDSSWVSLDVALGGPVVVRNHEQPFQRLTLANAAFMYNTVVHGSGGIWIHSSAPPPPLRDYAEAFWHSSIIDSVFVNNQGSEGGALWWNYMAAQQEAAKPCFLCSEGNVPSLNISKSEFHNNVARLSGGAISIAGVSAQITASVFERNQASVRGGAIRVVNASLAASDSQFLNNVIKQAPDGAATEVEHKGLRGGGAVAIAHCNHPGYEMTNSFFMNNAVNQTEVTHGGAALVENCLATLDMVNFTSNTVYGGGGGALFLSHIAAGSTLSNASISGNSAETHGGGMVVEAGSHMVLRSIDCRNNSVFTNTAAAGRIPSPYDESGIGGCLSLRAHSNVEVSLSELAMNEAVQGGGLHSDCNSSLDFRGVIFTENRSPGFGSSLFFECPSKWLSHHELVSAGVVYPDSTFRALGSGPTSLAVIETIPELFEGVLERDYVVLRVALLDINEEVIVTENSTVCSVVAKAPGDDRQPGLLEQPRYTARNGYVDVRPFGVIARDVGTIEINMSCKETLTPLP